MQKDHPFVAAVFVLGLFAVLCPPGVSAQENPLSVVKTGTHQIISILKDLPPGESLRSGKNREAAVKLISEYFDFDEMSSRSLGRYWKQQVPEKRSQFITLFRELFCNVYFKRIEGEDLGGLEIQFDDEKVETKYAIVKTRITTPKFPPASVEYRMILKDGFWKIYDVVVEGISFVGNYRTQFSSLLDRESFDAVIKQLEERTSA